MTDFVPKIAILRQMPGAVLTALAAMGEVLRPNGEEPLRGEAATRHLRPADAALVSPMDAVTADMIEGAANLKWISSIGAGLNHIDLEACARRGIEVVNAPDPTSEPTADLAFALMLAAARRIPPADRFVRDGRWLSGAPPFWGLDIHHRTLGIVGMGRIGVAIARRAQGFSMRVLYHNRRRAPGVDAPGIDAQWRELDQLMAESDFVIVQAPLTPESHHLIDARAIARMKPTAILVNTGRGGLVDEGALVDALETGRIAGAALDVLEAEPDVDPRLLRAPNLILAPHVGTATQATRQEMAEHALANLGRMLSTPRAE